MFISTAYAQPAPTAAAGGFDIMSFMPIILMFVVLYFLMIRPQMKRQKELKAMIDALAKGDEVVTIGGILGKIVKVNDTMLTLEVASGVEVQVERSAVSKPLPKGTMK
jgi:preprotein translocase subunit YajC